VEIMCITSRKWENMGQKKEVGWTWHEWVVEKFLCWSFSTFCTCSVTDIRRITVVTSALRAGFMFSRVTVVAMVLRSSRASWMSYGRGRWLTTVTASGLNFCWAFLFWALLFWLV
jgi:hypothetical protein